MCVIHILFIYGDGGNVENPMWKTAVYYTKQERKVDLP